MTTKKDIIIVDKFSEDFPMTLHDIKDCPEQLYCIGNIELLSTRAVAIVGSRKTTQYGRNTAREIGSELARRGVTVVSGMATGIDTCAHEGALKVEGNTIAVLGCGPDICYPSINKALKRQIETVGLVISEYPPGTPVDWFRFPQRNRIISGLCESTIVVQAGMRSGSMITAELAMEQNRNVFAVPGNIDSQYNLGSNKLIKDGVVPILTIGDLLETIGLDYLTTNDVENLLSDSEKTVYYQLIEHGEMTIDELCFHLGETPATVTKILTVMELKGIVFDEIGKFFVAKK